MDDVVTLNDAQFVGMVNAIRKVCYDIIDSLPPETKTDVRFRIEAHVETMEEQLQQVPDSRDLILGEIQTFKTFLADVPWGAEAEVE